MQLQLTSTEYLPQEVVLSVNGKSEQIRDPALFGACLITIPAANFVRSTHMKPQSEYNQCDDRSSPIVP